MKYNAKVFYLPTVKRPERFGPVPDEIRDYWHVGIVYEGKVYETFSRGKNMISIADKRIPELDEMGAEWQDVSLKDPSNLDNFLRDGLSCDNYVEKVLGFELTKEKYVIKRNFTKEMK